MELIRLDPSTAALLVVVAVIAANQVVARVAWVARRGWLFWPVQVIDLGVAGAVLWFGLPGFDHVRAVSVVVGLMLVMHVAQNLRARSAIARDDAREEARARSAERARAIRDALEAAEAHTD